jgi:hypothetical protein
LQGVPADVWPFSSWLPRWWMSSLPNRRPLGRPGRRLRLRPCPAIRSKRSQSAALFSTPPTDAVGKPANRKRGRLCGLSPGSNPPRRRLELGAGASRVGRPRCPGAGSFARQCPLRTLFRGLALHSAGFGGGWAAVSRGREASMSRGGAVRVLVVDDHDLSAPDSAHYWRKKASRRPSRRAGRRLWQHCHRSGRMWS